MWHKVYQRLLAPRATDEDARRKELILNILLVGIICLTGVLFAVTVFQSFIQGIEYKGTSPFAQLIIVAVFIAFLLMSHRGWHTVVSYIFISMFFLLATWPMVLWGVGLPQAILAYSLVIAMTGVLLSSRTAFYMAGVISLTMLLVTHLAESEIIMFDLGWTKTQPGYNDVVAYGITFLIIALVAWLSNREVDRSLRRARQSEKELLEERNSLERKVRERTKALEKAQVEKMLDLQRFAEFGRLSSTLLHELANPLTSVSLNLERLGDENRSHLLKHAREGIAHMEQYVDAARRQLRNQSEIKLFDTATEVQRVAGLLESKARTQHAIIELDLAKGVSLKGDSIRFNHIISNLVTNAIDAYEDIKDTEKRKTVTIETKRKGEEIQITVTDHGRGITKEQLPHLFEPFFTTKDTVRGTGIGLAITKQAVEDAFQGKITALYSKEKGTRFVVRLPLT